ncbi:hypothetical protein GGR51DRAFT_565160 [Nemania sp. FL0031]|nr:hypothetical protein GGR51DRAFT_565160 [Nemania sp. FL0031]
MDVSTASGSDTDSDSNDAFAIQPTGGNNIHIKNVPAFVVWRDPLGENRSLPDLTFSLLYISTSSTQKALVQLQATTRLKKGPAKPTIYLLVKPDQICTLAYISNEADLDRGQEDLHSRAREDLGASTHVLRFDLRSPATFVVPSEYSFKFFRAGSQAVWTTWKDFARDTHRFFLHFPMTSLSKAQLLSFCQAASGHGVLTSLSDNISSLYGGKGGRVVDPQGLEGNDATEAEASAGIPCDERTAPPAYEERAAAGPSLSSEGPCLCLSPEPSPRQSRKRRRVDNGGSSDYEDTTTNEKDKKANDRILQAIVELHRTMNEARAVHESGISKIIAKVEEMEGRFKQLEEDQRTLADEVRTHMAPLWDEMDARLQSQEDREQVYIRDVIEEVVGENIKEKMAETIDEYFNSDDEGQDLIRKVIGEKVQEETRDYLQNQRFVGHFTLNQETSLI